MLGHIDLLSRNIIGGWAADPSHPDEEVLLRVTVNGAAVCVVANEMCEDVKGAFPNLSGRHGFRPYQHIFPLSPFVDNEVRAISLETGEVVAGGSARIPAVLMCGYVDRLAPGENAPDLSLDLWQEILANALAITREARAPC